MKVHLATACALFALIAGSTAAQAPAASPPAATQPADPTNATTVEEVVVTAQRPEEALRAFVRDVAPEVRDGQLGRWDRSICPGVAGMNQRYGEAMNDRLAQVAYDVGLDVGEPGCTPNVLILATANSDALARDLIANQRQLVAYHVADGNSQGRAALRAFAESTQPVRWWHVTRTATSDGEVVAPGEAATIRTGSRVRSETRQDFDRIVIIVDIQRARGVPFGALVDYVAMAALAQLDPNARTSGHDTILNLFAERDAGRPVPAGLTEWDKAYLRGLYSTARDLRNQRTQEEQIVERMRSATPGTAS